MKLSDLKPGDKIAVDSGFTCMPASIREVKASESGELFVSCSHGRHYLDGQEDEDGELVGIAPAPQTAAAQ